MTRVGIISDTHSFFDGRLRDFLAGVDVVWHAGDFGSLEAADAIAGFKPLVGVYGNIDDARVRVVWPRFQLFSCEDVKVLMTHIGGYPGHYDRETQARIDEHRPKIFISGHSHILKVMPDRPRGLLHINPGGAGIYGIHRVRTAVRLVIDGSDIRDLEVGEWAKSVYEL